MQKELKFKFVDNGIEEFLSAFINEMIALGYSEWYIGKVLARIIRVTEQQE